jgi:hypothetical protein
VWGLLTAGLTGAYAVWEYRDTPRDSLWGACLQLGSPTHNPFWAVVGIGLHAAVLILFMSIPAWILYAIVMALLLPLRRRPCSEQAGDYDDARPARPTTPPGP